MRVKRDIIIHVKVGPWLKLSLPSLLKERKLFHFILNARVRVANLLSGLVPLVVLWLSLTSFTLIKYFFLEIGRSDDFGNILGKKFERKGIAILHYLEKGCFKYFLSKKSLNKHYS